MVNFWNRIVSGNQNKFSFIMYSLTKKIHEDPSNDFSSKWIFKLKDILNRTGLGFYWDNQYTCNGNQLKDVIKTRIFDIANQNWCSDINDNSSCVNYRILKNSLVFEKYLIKLDFNERIHLSRFRCGNTKLPSNRRFNVHVDGLDILDKSCNLCSSNLIGDEYHYLFECSKFENERTRLLKPYFRKRPNTIKMYELFNSSDVKMLSYLAKFTKIIQDSF